MVLNLGSGSAGDTTTVLAKNPGLRGIDMCCVDIDTTAISFGEKFAKNFSEINFVKKSMTRLPSIYNNSSVFGLLIGILCGLDYENCVNLLRTVKRYFRLDAMVVSAALTEKMLQDDLFCSYLSHEIANWNLQFPCFGRLQMAYEEAGYKVKEIITDSPTNFYEIVIAQV